MNGAGAQASPKQCSQLKSSMPCKRDLALQNIPLSKQPFETQPQIENEVINIICPPQEPISTRHCHYMKWSWMVDS